MESLKMKAKSLLIMGVFSISLVFSVVIASTLLFWVVSNSKDDGEYNDHFNNHNFKSNGKESSEKYLDSSTSRYDTTFFQSKFGQVSNNYKCYGSCHCTIDDDRRVASNHIAKRGLVFFLTAASSVIAYNLGKRNFEDECKKRLSDSCPQNSIESEVDKCESSDVVNDEKVDETGPYFDESEMDWNDEDDGENRVYFCYGNCVQFRRLSTHRNYMSTIEMQEKLGYDCKTLKKEAEVDVSKTDLYDTKIEFSGNLYAQQARNKFSGILTKYCKENSKIESGGEYKYVSKSGKKQTIKLKWKLSVCRGHDGKRNIRCLQTFPEPNDLRAFKREREWWIQKEKWEKS